MPESEAGTAVEFAGSLVCANKAGSSAYFHSITFTPESRWQIRQQPTKPMLRLTH